MSFLGHMYQPQLWSALKEISHLGGHADFRTFFQCSAMMDIEVMSNFCSCLSCHPEDHSVEFRKVEKVATATLSLCYFRPLFPCWCVELNRKTAGLVSLTFFWQVYPYLKRLHVLCFSFKTLIYALVYSALFIRPIFEHWKLSLQNKSAIVRCLGSSVVEQAITCICRAVLRCGAVRCGQRGFDSWPVANLSACLSPVSCPSTLPIKLLWPKNSKKQISNSKSKPGFWLAISIELSSPQLLSEWADLAYYSSMSLLLLKSPTTRRPAPHLLLSLFIYEAILRFILVLLPDFSS